jgi:hypothetical protein
MKIIDLIDKELLKEQEDRKLRERSGKYSPSSFGRCFRAQLFNRLNEPQSNPTDIRSLRIFKVGKLFHDFVQSYLPEHQVEVKIETEHICGYADIVTDKAVYDIKSQHSKSFWYMEKTDFNVEKEKYSNILQVIIYAMILKKPIGSLIFISKDDLCTAEYSFSVENWQEEVKKEIKTLIMFWEKWQKEKILPPPQPRAYGVDKKTGQANECSKYCAWRDTCFKLEGKKIPEKEGEK